MRGKLIKIRSSGGGEFDCYLTLPEGGARTPAIVLACDINGFNDDQRAIADEFASHGYIAAVPDLFWRSSAPGALPRGDERARPRGQPRLEKIKTGEADMTDTLAEVRKLPQFNGRAATMGFCYGGPYAILGPKRLGYEAGVSCHGTQLLDYINELEGVTKPVCIVWGDKDHAMTPETQEAYRKVPSRMKNVEVHIFPGVHHGYMMKGNPEAFSRETYDFTMKRALEIMGGLRGEPLKKAS